MKRLVGPIAVVSGAVLIAGCGGGSMVRSWKLTSRGTSSTRSYICLRSARLDECIGQALGGFVQVSQLTTALDPLRIDLDALWKRLGVVRSKDGVSFDDRAPQAALRRAITRP